MSKIELTVRQIMNLGLWEKVCEYKGWNPWILNEGQIDESELVEFDDEFKKEPKYIEDLAGETITQIRPVHNDFGACMIEIYLENGTVLKIEREHSEDHYLEWNIEVL